MGSYNQGSEKQDYSAFGEAIKAHRERLGWSLRQAAKSIGVLSYGRLRDFELGKDPHSALPTRPTEAQIARLAAVYKADKRTLLRLAGYSGIGPLEEWEEDVILAARSMDPAGRARLLDLIASLPREGKS